MFSPKTKYLITSDKTKLIQFDRFADKYITRPPYQRKSVWNKRKQQALLDSLFRRFYIPRLVMRIVRIDDDTAYKEVIDGQQRINTIQNFYNGKTKLPDSLKNLNTDIVGKKYEDLPVDVREYFDELSFDVDIVQNIEEPDNPDHQEIATEIFWRLQQGESLTYMEKAHARLSSLARNFVVKYSDDITFDFDTYKPIDDNPDKHKFFNVISRGNNRMQHLALLTRLIILKENDGSTDLKNDVVVDFINDYKRENGINNLTFEERKSSKQVLTGLNLFYKVFKEDPLFDENSNGLPFFKSEYFIISTFMLLMHINDFYVFKETEEKLFREFIHKFHDRWKAKKENDYDILVFSDNRQQSAQDIATRHRIIRQLFFEFANEQGVNIKTKDDQRAFSEAQRIKIYRKANGLCQLCLEEDKPEKEAYVPWSDYEADHVLPHSHGGLTNVNNAQVLCRRHNRIKGNRH